MSRNRQYTKKELESLRRADLQNLYKIHGLKGANQKSDALIETLVVHFASAAYIIAPESPSGPSNRRLKSIDVQTTTRITKDVPVRRPATAASVSRPVKAPIRPVSRLKKATQLEVVTPVAPATTSIAPEWEERLQRMEEVWTERLRQAEAAFEEKLRLVEERWEARWTSAQPNIQTHPSPPASTPRVVITDPSPLKRPLHQDEVSALEEEHARKRLRSETASEQSTPPRAEREGTCGVFRTPPDRVPDPRTPDPSHQGRLDDMSRTPGVGDDVTGLPYPIFATTPKPAEPRSPTLDAPPSGSRQRAWSSNSMPKMLTPGRKRTAAEVAPRAVSQAHMDLTTITESDEAPLQLRRQTTPVLFPPARSRDRTTTPPRLSPSPSITERAFQHPAYPSRGSSLVPLGPRPRQTSTPARDYMDVALHGLPNPMDSPSGFITPGHRTILGTERYRDTRFGDIPSLSWGSPSVDFGSATPAPR